MAGGSIFFCEVWEGVRAGQSYEDEVLIVLTIAARVESKPLYMDSTVHKSPGEHIDTLAASEREYDPRGFATKYVERSSIAE